MLSNSLRNLFRRPATRLYPQEPFEPVPLLRGHTEYDMTKCIMCLLCSKRCPNEAIETDREARQHKVHRMRCMACGLCVDTCPTDTITMVPTYSPPAYQRTVDTYIVRISEHQRVISELPPFVRELAPGERPEPAFTPPPAVVAAPAQTEAKLRVDDMPASCAMWPVKDIMVRNVVSVTPDVRIVEVARLLLENDISGVPVVDTQRRVVGIVTERDIMSAPRGKVPLTLRHMFSRIFLGDGHARPGE
jgi:ech hydrogenase subunit F